MEAQQDLDTQRGRRGRMEAVGGGWKNQKRDEEREQRRLQGLKSCFSEGWDRNKCIRSKCCIFCCTLSVLYLHFPILHASGTL